MCAFSHQLLSGMGVATPQSSDREALAVELHDKSLEWHKVFVSHATHSGEHPLPGEPWPLSRRSKRHG